MDEYFICPCCGYRTLDDDISNESYQICVVCFWENDPIQFNDPDYEGGANDISLRKAQKNFIKFGACSEKFIQNVRKPYEEEGRDNGWKPLD